MFICLVIVCLFFEISGIAAGQQTNFCLQQKPQLVKCSGPFYDHMKEMGEAGVPYQHSGDLRSMKDLDQCLSAEMEKCPEEDHIMFKEIMFMTYGVEMDESSRAVQPNQELCYSIIPEISAIDVKLLDFRKKRGCTQEDAKRWLGRIQLCLNRRIAKLKDKSLKLKEVTSQRALRYVELCIHVHKVLPCKPAKMEIFEPLFKELLSGSKNSLLSLVESLKSKTPNVQDAEKCVQQLDNEDMQNCIPKLFEEMNSLYSSTGPPKKEPVAEQCISGALNECKDKTRSIIDYVLKSGMGIVQLDDSTIEKKNDTIQVCRLTKAVDVGYQECTSNILHTELEFINYCLQSSVPENKQLDINSAIQEVEKCIYQHMTSNCYIPNEKLLSRMVEYTFVVIADFLKHRLNKDDKCLQQVTDLHVSKCAPLLFKYVGSLKQGEMLQAMDHSKHTMDCLHDAVKDCPPPATESVLKIFPQIGRCNFVSTTVAVDIVKEKIVRIERDVGDEFEQSDGHKISFHFQENESAENVTSHNETVMDAEVAYAEARSAPDMSDESNTTEQTLQGGFTNDERETTTEGKYAETDMQDMTTSSSGLSHPVNKSDVHHLQQCSASTFPSWIYKYHACFQSEKYKDNARDLKNTITRLFTVISNCMKDSLDKRCFPQWDQMEEFLEEVVYQAKDYAEMYLSEIRKGREDIADLRCAESLSVELYENCTQNFFKYLESLRNHLVNSDGFEYHANTAVTCLIDSYEKCSKTATKKLIEVVEVLLDLSNGTLWKREDLFLRRFPPPPAPENKSLGTKIVEFFKTVGSYIAKPFVWLYNTIKSWFGW